METIGVRELQQRASAVLRRVGRGEVLGVTERGRLVAVLGPPSTATGVGALVTADRVRPGRRLTTSLPETVRSQQSVAEVVDELRADE